MNACHAESSDDLTIILPRSDEARRSGWVCRLRNPIRRENQRDSSEVHLRVKWNFCGEGAAWRCTSSAVGAKNSTRLILTTNWRPNC
jgi:hypothetical protein